MQAGVTWCLVGASLSLALLVSPTATAQQHDGAPPLPDLAIEAFPAAAREDLGGAYRRARERPDAADAVSTLAMLLQTWEQYEPAARAYARAQALAPDAVDWWYLGGLVADRQAHRSEAVQQFEAAHTLAPDHPLIALRLADARLAVGDSAGASELYRRLVDVAACAPASWYGLGRIYLMEKADGQARAAFEKALELYPAFGAAHYAMAQIHRRARETDAARTALVRQRQCLACWPMPDDPWKDRLDTLRNDAAILITRGLARASSGTAAADAEAIRLHEAALERDPLRTQAHLNLIELYGRTGNAADAERHFIAARDLPAFAADAHRAWGIVLLSLRKPVEALAHLQDAARQLPGDATTQQAMGLAFEMLDRPADAAAAYTRTLRAAPTSRDARFGLARVSMRLDKADDAIAHLEHLREPVDGETARYLFALSVAHVRRGNVAEGRKVAEQALEVARRFGDTRTAANIETELRKLRPTP